MVESHVQKGEKQYLSCGYVCYAPNESRVLLFNSMKDLINWSHTSFLELQLASV